MTNREIVTKAYEGFNHRDLEAVLALMSPEIDWPNAMENTRELGRDAVRAYWTRQWAMIDPRVDPIRIETDATGREVVDVHQVVRDLTGTLLADQMVRHIYRIEDGLIVHMEIAPYPGSPE